MWPGFKSRHRRHMWVEFVVGSLPCSERFISGYSGFLLSSKANISKFQFDQESGRQRTTTWMCYLQIVICLFTYLVYSPHQYRHFPCPPQRFSSKCKASQWDSQGMYKTHACQLSWIIWESPRYNTNLLVSWRGHQISQIK